MYLHLLTILTDQGDICEVLVIPQILKQCVGIVLEVRPLQTKLIHHDLAAKIRNY